MSRLGGIKQRWSDRLQRWTHTLSSVTSVTTGLSIITTITSFTASLLDVLGRRLGIAKGTGLQCQHGEDESLSDLHFELGEENYMSKLVKSVSAGYSERKRLLMNV